MLEGNEEMATLSAMSALPFIGSVVGSGIRLGFKASKFFNKAAKTAKYIEKISEVVSYTGSFTVSAVNLKHDVTNAIKEYKKTGSISAESVFSILADRLGVGLSGKGLVSSGKSLRKMLQADFTGVGKNTSLKEALSKNKFELGNQAGGTGNRLSYDLQYFANKGGVNTDWITNKGYKPQPGERTLEGFMKNNISPDAEVGLYTKSSGFNNNKGDVGGQFKRFGAEEHGGLAPHVHQPTRNVAPNGNIYGSTGSKTANGGVTSPTKLDIKQLYDYLFNGKYRQ
ncbi:hypothetical protein DWV06_15395 [Anaerosacchariphilus polymeriproducens]|uniref:Pre-toxin TG domain-containing protein n=1 Tax=Anaerosacchariphilus polymeriproducens TaxID=1812858 RepID=A0A371ASV4_9FIRM|nr:hypothetical protein DWV06_15395 [Anaerosacchariphilus polymeriproducens]